MAGEGDFKNLLFAFVLTALFGVLLMTSVISFGNEYSQDTSLVVNGSLGLEEFDESISSFEENAEDMQEAFATGNIFSVIAGIVVEGIFGIAVDIMEIILSPFRVVSNILVDVFGVPVFATSILMGLLIFSMIFAIWRLIKIGS